MENKSEKVRADRREVDFALNSDRFSEVLLSYRLEVKCLFLTRNRTVLNRRVQHARTCRSDNRGHRHHLSIFLGGQIVK